MSSQFDLGIDDIVQRIRDEAARRERGAGPERAVRSGNAATAGADRWQLDALPRFHLERRGLKIKSKYMVEDFLEFDDEEFVQNAYAGILRRGADPVGSSSFLDALRSGQRNKIDVLGRLRYSREGRLHSVRIAGLLPGFVLGLVRRVPILGSIAAFTRHLIGLPAVSMRLDRLRASSERGAERFAFEGNAIVDAIEQVVQRVGDVAMHAQAEARSVAERLGSKASEERVMQLQSALATLERSTPRAKDVVDLQHWASELAGRLENAERAKEALESTLSTKADALSARIQKAEALLGRFEDLERGISGVQRQVVDHRRDIADQQRRLGILLDELRQRAQSPVDSATDAAAIAREQDHLLDAFYVSFEDRFRGAREDIKRRVAVYLDVVRSARAGTADAPVVDLACGRGEWLEVLRDGGLEAKGVDLNRVMIAECRQRGLQVTEADLLAYLRALPDHSAGTITGFHIIEHLPFEQVVAVLDESLRVIRAGGLVIFETPNPENILVGSCNFYLDPTHRNPLPPEVMRFALEARGYSEVRVQRLHPLDIPGIEASSDASFVTTLLTAPQDYAIIGAKA